MYKRYPKKRAMSFIEIIVAMGIFLIAIIPIIEFNNKLFTMNRSILQMEIEEMIFNNVVSLVKSKDFDIISNKKGENKYQFILEDDQVSLYPIDELVDGVQSKNLALLGSEFIIIIEDLQIENINKFDKLKIIKFILQGKKKKYSCMKFITYYDKYNW
ncbi:MAG: hypothetical protein LBT51_11135 [Fusobacteriaceae bacterium]|jgi:hypothetical protein|nr:hypothetical protein [Fusobacteriaceae bacterium]